MRIARNCPYSDDKENCKYKIYDCQPRLNKCSTCERFLKKNFPDIDTSKMNITEDGNIIRNETLIRPWQQHMIELLEKNERLEKENTKLKQQIEKMKRCSNCKHNECKCEDVVCKKENECWYDKAEEEHLFLELEKVKLECWELAE